MFSLPYNLLILQSETDPSLHPFKMWINGDKQHGEEASQYNFCKQRSLQTEVFRNLLELSTQLMSGPIVTMYFGFQKPLVLNKRFLTDLLRSKAKPSNKLIIRLIEQAKYLLVNSFCSGVYYQWTPIYTCSSAYQLMMWTRW